MGTAIVVGIIVVVVAGAIGWLAGGRGATDTRYGQNGDVSDCEAACEQWDARRSDLCTAEEAVETARTVHDATRDILTALIGLEFGAIGAAVAAGTAAATVISAAVLAAIVTLSVFAVFAIAAAIVAVTAALARAALILNRARSDAADARAALNRARALVNEHCSTEEAAACFATPGPC